MKTLFQALLAVFVLLSQTMPLVAAVEADGMQEKCKMACCEGTHGCCCASDGDQQQPEPAGMPPGSGREILPQIMCVKASSTPALADLFTLNESVIPRPTHADTTRGLPHVRFTVLFCAFLT